MLSAINSGAMEPSIVHSIVDGFFEVKKVEVKQRLQFEMDRVVDDLFGELVGQVKQLLLPNAQAKVAKQESFKSVIAEHSSVGLPIEPTRAFVQRKSPPKQDKPKLPKANVYAVKSVPRSTGQTGKMTSSSPSEPLVMPTQADSIELSTPKVNTDFPAENKCPSGNSNDGQKTLNCFEKKLQIKSEYPDTSSITIDMNTNDVIEKNAFDVNANDNQAILNKPEKRQRTESTSNGSNKKVKPDDSPNSKPRGKFICSSVGCGKSFDRMFVLKRHERIHENVKPYRCRWTACSYASINRSHAIKHIQSVHLARLSKQAGPEQAESQVDPKLYLEVDQNMLK